MQVSIIPVTAFAQNATLLSCESTGEAAIIDPGGDVEVLLRALEQHQLNLVKIFLTHGHIDHVGGVAELLRYKAVPVEGPHEDDRFLIDGLLKQSQMFGLPRVDVFEPTRWLAEGDSVSFGDITLEVLHCPGHTPGHVVFYQRETGLLQVGDVLFKGSIGRTDFPRGNHDQLINSIQQKLFCLPDETVFIPGHGPTSTIGEEKISNPYVGINNGGG